MLLFLERNELSAWSDGSKEVRVQWQKATEMSSIHNSLWQTHTSQFLIANNRKEEKKLIKVKTVSTYDSQSKYII